MTEQPEKKDWKNASITIPDWMAIVFLIAVLLGLSWWVSEWTYSLTPIRARDTDDLLIGCSSSYLFFPLMIFMASMYALWVGAAFASAAGRPRTFTHRHVRVLMWVHGLIRFHVAPTAETLDQQGFLSPLRSYLRQTLEGASPANAIINTLKSLPRRSANLLLAAESIHCLEPALARTIEQFQQTLQEAYASRPRLLSIGPLLYIVALIPPLTFVFFPHYLRRFLDFDTAMPPIASTLFVFCKWFTVGGHAMGIPNWPLLNLPGFLWVLILLLTFIYSIKPAAPGVRDFSQLSLALKVPWLGRVLADRDWASVYALLAMAIARGIPLPQAIRAANLPDLNQFIKAPLARWETLLSTGQAPAQAAAAAAMPDRLVALLKLSATNTGLAQSLQQLARFHDTRADWSARRLASLIPAGLTLVSGCVVGLLVLGFADAARAVYFHVQNHWH